MTAASSNISSYSGQNSTKSKNALTSRRSYGDQLSSQVSSSSSSSAAFNNRQRTESDSLSRNTPNKGAKHGSFLNALFPSVNNPSCNDSNVTINNSSDKKQAIVHDKNNNHVRETAQSPTSDSVDSSSATALGDNDSELSFGVQVLDLMEEKGSPTISPMRQASGSFSSASSAQVGLSLSDTSDGHSTGSIGNRKPDHDSVLHALEEENHRSLESESDDNEFIEDGIIVDKNGSFR
jgi:hypothetical protein